ncbi:hypothetical protein NQ317_011286 [Molorchus minor]|uniref:Uncharacterized protein n=1 Tax=Molorchus minor TaxID=1323400 RepID=A0ABQ9JVE3_9CUCU|nr:hypothetical protein NQ317_011286 [Molorchus minor]
MAQFVTHIQPTLMESSHHHNPAQHHHHHLFKELHRDHHKEHHGKDHHSKEHLGKEQAGKEHYKSPHKDSHHIGHLGHSREFPVMPHTPAEHHHEVETPQNDSKRSSRQYIDSHGVPHEFELSFLDSQGIHRDFQGHGINDEEFRKDVQMEKEETSPFRESTRPTPPQSIDIRPIHMENKHWNGMLECDRILITQSKDMEIGEDWEYQQIVKW